MSKRILITGGTGLVGSQLSKMLIEKGYQVAFLSRKKINFPNIKVYQWNIETGFIEPEALQNTDIIIHLAGAGIADSRWTDKRKTELISSRVKPVELMMNEIIKNNHQIEAFISASAIGFYGGDSGEIQQTEKSKSGNDFLAKCTIEWEKAVDLLALKTNIKTTKIRIGVVFSEKGGALEKIILPIKAFIGSPIGTGKQWISWIHIDDLCRVFIETIVNSWQGTINAVAENPVRNEDLTNVIASVLDRPLFAPKVPAFVLKMLLGEMSVVVLGSSYVENERLKNELNFKFNFPTIEEAIQNLLG